MSSLVTSLVILHLLPQYEQSCHGPDDAAAEVHISSKMVLDGPNAVRLEGGHGLADGSTQHFLYAIRR